MAVLEGRQLELAQSCARIKEIKLQIKELENQIKAHEEVLKNELTAQEIDTLVLGCFKVTWKPVDTTRIDSKKLKAEMPEIYEKYSSTSTSKRFLVD